MQVAELYKKARGTKLSKAKLRAAMAEMDADGNGEVELSEFQEWWAANGGLAVGDYTPTQWATHLSVVLDDATKIYQDLRRVQGGLSRFARGRA